ncbi:MAG: endopeptidase La [Roseburia sp.]|nr:endopeptidase La [Roseburia sp.]
MAIIPVYNSIILPDTTFYFKKDLLEEMNIHDIKEGEDVVFLIRRDINQKDKEIKEADAKASEPAEPNEDEKKIEKLEDEFYPIGVAGKVLSVDENGTASIEAKERMDITKVTVEDQHYNLEAETREDIMDMDEQELLATVKELRRAVLNYVKQFQWGIMAREYIVQWKNVNEIAVSLSSYLNLNNEERYAIVAADKMTERVDLIKKAVYEFIEISNVSGEAELAQKETNDKIYREDAIRKQIDFLQKKLDEMHPENVSEVRRFQDKIEESGMNETARKEADKILNRMAMEGKDSHEYGMLYDYLDFVTTLDWKKEPYKDVSLDEAEKILDERHYGLDKVKKRIIQQLAVMSLNHKQSGSILLFVGAPGTGKTSIGQSIAEALHRKYVRVSLGGVRDEAEIRGHRRTYIGAMPGRIMEGMKQCGTSNPVMVLDEIDKLGHDYNGDPASALLEVLDPEQNNTFTDHYMNVPYDLSDVFFVCTANSTDGIPTPLLDRMEIIQFPGYTAVEKFQIAKRHLLPQAREQVGIKAKDLKVSDEAIRKIISDYTMESGVRGLKKQLTTLCRYAAVEFVKGEKKSVSVSPRRLPKFLDQKPYHHESILQEKAPGVVTGLAWTAAGGEILFIETKMVKGSGKVQITGQLGDVMKESTSIALTLVKAMYPDKAELFEKNDIHIHVPAGAVPKDGPSAGITLTTALASLVTGKPVGPEYAMTGEVSLRGVVMPIGGLPEKLMAAQRAGIKKVFIPADNVEDLDDVAKEVRDSLEIIPVHKVTDVLKKVLKEKL